MQKRKLKDLNLLDDFLFNSMVTYPGIGEEFSRELLKIIFQKDFGKLTVIPQKTYYGSDTDLHGMRLDVYLEESENKPGILSPSTIFDIEPNLLGTSEIISSLPKRMRFYHAKIGARTLFLYTKGSEGNPTLELKQLLQYMQYTTSENAQNKTLQNIHKMVETVKQDQEVSLAYMKIFEREEIIFNQGIEQERANTERERQRAEKAEQEVRRLQEELKKLQEDRTNP